MKRYIEFIGEANTWDNKNRFNTTNNNFLDIRDILLDLEESGIFRLVVKTLDSPFYGGDYKYFNNCIFISIKKNSNFYLSDIEDYILRLYDYSIVSKINIAILMVINSTKGYMLEKPKRYVLYSNMKLDDYTALYSRHYTDDITDLFNISKNLTELIIYLG